MHVPARVLVVVDGSRESLECLDSAVALARRSKARLVVVIASSWFPVAVVGSMWAPAAVAVPSAPDRGPILDRVPADQPVHVIDATDRRAPVDLVRAAQELRCDTLVAPQSRSSRVRRRVRRLSRRAGLETVWAPASAGAVVSA